MPATFESLKTNFLCALHGFIDWTNRWGSPRSAREEAVYFEMQANIQTGKIELKSLVGRLRSSLEHFLDDYRMEPHAKERIGNLFVEKSSQLLENAQACENTMPEEEQALLSEVKKMLNAVNKQIKNST